MGVIGVAVIAVDGAEGGRLGLNPTQRDGSRRRPLAQVLTTTLLRTRR